MILYRNSGGYMGPKVKDIKTWTKALRSGKYKQTDGGLQDTFGYCCLGVACDLFIDKKKLVLSPSRGFMSGAFPADQPKSPKWLANLNKDFKNITGEDIASLNDEGANVYEVKRLTFDEIADLLEAVYIHKVLK
jgi:hypothetical protein